MTREPRPAGRRVVATARLLSLYVAAISPALAQPAKEAAPRRFAPEFFAAFNPVTAEDMVRRVPGFTVSDGADRRGFAGAAGNVLINGERPSSKTAISEQLARLSARDVERIDLYSGGDGGEMRGQTLYVDVRLRPRDAKATNTFVMQASRLEPSGSINPLIVVTSAFRSGDATVNLALQAQPARRGRIEYDKTLRSATGTLIEQGEEFLQGSYREYKFSGRTAWKPTSTDAFSLNAQVTPSRDGRHTYSETLGPTGALIRREDSKVEGDDAWAAEIGGDWERKLSANASFKLVGLASEKHTGSSERYTTRTPSSTRDTLIQRGADTGEYLARGSFSWKPDARHAVEFGVEGAFNYLDSELDVQLRTAAGTTNVTPPVADTRVEEQRGEASVSDTWQISDTLKLESGLAYEVSRITQTGDRQQERDFTYFKPRVRAGWKPSQQDEVRLLLERDVAQLDFTEFATAINPFDGTQNIGNPDLEPERTWRAQVEWERHVGARGVLSLSAFYDDVEAVQDQIPIIVYGATGMPVARLDGAGNLGDGTRIGARLDAVAPLDALGLARGELRLKGMVQQTRVDDPLTGKTRRFSDEAEWSYSIDIRQPLPELKLLWGALYERSDNIHLFRVQEHRTTGWDTGSLDLYVETTAMKGLVVRFTVQDVFLPAEVRTRAFYSPDRSLPGNLSTIETRNAHGGYGTRSFAVRASGRF